MFLGRHVAAEALARGHELTTFTRGRHGGIEGAEQLIGDRAGDLSALEGREWDVCRVEFPGTWAVGTARAQAAGLRCRPVAETVADVWAWLRDGGEAEQQRYIAGKARGPAGVSAAFTTTGGSRWDVLECCSPSWRVR